MSDVELTVRNLTRNTITLERYEVHDRVGQPKGGRLDALSKNVTSLFSAAKDPSLLCKVNQVIGAELIPFASIKVQVKKPKLPDQILCVFFDIEAEKYQSNIIHARHHSQYLMPTNGKPDPRHKRITMYLPEYHHLTIGYRDSYRSWMGSLRDDIPISALSIPGTHNSPAHYKALPSVRCQCVSVGEQLRKGVRFLDVRVQPQHHKVPLKDGLLLVHSVFPVSLAGPHHFRSLVNEVLLFLKENPTETVIMSVKREGTGSASDEYLSRILHLFYAHDLERWFTTPRIPYLGEVRGKIVLFRRFRLDETLQSEWGGSGWGIDASVWADKSPHSVCPSGDVCIQDFYEVSETQNITEKIQYSTEHLRRAADSICPTLEQDAVQKQPLFVNFLTASNFWKMGCWPDRIAAKINPAIIEYLCLQHHEGQNDANGGGNGSTGVVVCDWVGSHGNWDIVRCIVGMNSLYEKPK